MATPTQQAWLDTINDAERAHLDRVQKDVAEKTGMSVEVMIPTMVLATLKYAMDHNHLVTQVDAAYVLTHMLTFGWDGKLADGTAWIATPFPPDGPPLRVIDKLEYAERLEAAKKIVQQMVRDEGIPDTDNQMDSMLAAVLENMLGRPSSDPELGEKLRNDLFDYIIEGEADRDAHPPDPVELDYYLDDQDKEALNTAWNKIANLTDAEQDPVIQAAMAAIVRAVGEYLS